MDRLVVPSANSAFRISGFCGVISAGSTTEAAVTIPKMANAMNVLRRSEDSGVLESENLTAAWIRRNDASAAGSATWNRANNVCLCFVGEIFGLNGYSNEKATSFHLISEYEKSGLSFLENLNGCFAGFLFDLRQQKIVLFNDRYGLGRIYLHEADGRTFFATEAKALLSALPDLQRLDPRGFGEWCSCGCVLQERTLFDGISLLQGGSNWIFSADGSVVKKRYFESAAWTSLPQLPESEYFQRLRDMFPRVLRRYLGNDQVIGMSLTGGLDGRIIMAYSQMPPGAMPCYTFSGPIRDCLDARIARLIAQNCDQPHSIIRLGEDFLAAFPKLAEDTIVISDGAMNVTGAAELYLNSRAREFSAIRLTGNYGSEILRNNIAFRPSPLATNLFSEDAQKYIQAAAVTYAEESRGNPRSFIAFKQVPWHHFARSTIEKSQLTVRSPYLDNELVALAFQAPKGQKINFDCSARLIAEANPALGRISTDRGFKYGSNTIVNRLSQSKEQFLAKAEYAFDYGMPQWLAPIESFSSVIGLQRLFLGRQKFCHFRTWYRGCLAPYVREVLLDPRSLSRPYLRRRGVERIVEQHIEGKGNFTTEIHKLLSLELTQRFLLEES